MTNHDLTQNFAAIINAITAGQLENLDALVRWDITDHNLIPGQGDGLPGLKYWARTLRAAMPDLTATINDTVSEPGKIAARVQWAGTHTGDLRGFPATHSYYEYQSFYIVHFTEGLAVEWWDGSDTREALRHLYRRVRLHEARSTIDQYTTGF